MHRLSENAIIILVSVGVVLLIVGGVGAVGWYRAGVQQAVWERQGAHLTQWEVFCGAQPVVRTLSTE
jgi:hypothetical protein